MNLALNILWFLLGGVVLGVSYIVGGALLCLTVIGIPFGIETIKLGIACFAPFGKQVVPDEAAEDPLVITVNIIWLVFFGWEIAVFHLVMGVALLLTIVGIPFGLQHFKLLPIAVMPFARRFVAIETVKPAPPAAAA